ncbi:acetyl-CoA carboxylase biotin carboxyl carrier protein [Sphingomonas sp.]|uniref:acetyl-CoA carboxylase biotin carboxyl carrier protein n=1 Tax=Sphingomonas sp. TaxID=28214 RepID=UPI003752E2F7
MASLTLQDLETLIAQFGQSDWRQLHLHAGDLELFLSKDSGSRAPETRASAPAGAVAAAAPAQVPVSAPATAPAAARADVPDGWIVVKAPSLGTFYRAPKPGAAPFVEGGSTVDADSELCLIEVMKLFTTLRAGVTGVIREIYASDGDLVEYDQPLFLVGPGA